MGETETEAATVTAVMRRLRLAIVVSAFEDVEPGWRDDLRLFAFAWAAGFVFFLTVLV